MLGDWTTPQHELINQCESNITARAIELKQSNLVDSLPYLLDQYFKNRTDMETQADQAAQLAQKVSPSVNEHNQKDSLPQTLKPPGLLPGKRPTQSKLESTDDTKVSEKKNSTVVDVDL